MFTPISSIVFFTVEDGGEIVLFIGWLMSNAIPNQPISRILYLHFFFIIQNICSKEKKNTNICSL
jgi:hypothetical protein